LFLLAQLGGSTAYWQISIAMFVLGAGLGNMMQVLILAVQNAVPPRNIGTATSGATFFRSIGGSFGTAVFGAVWAARLTTELRGVLPPGSQTNGNPTSSMSVIRSLPTELQSEVLGAFARATDFTFLVAVPVMAIAFVLAWFVPQITLRKEHDPLPEPKPDLEGFDAEALEAEVKTLG
jgi:hypothetical protein